MDRRTQLCQSLCISDVNFVAVRTRGIDICINDFLIYFLAPEQMCWRVGERAIREKYLGKTGQLHLKSFFFRVNYYSKYSTSSLTCRFFNCRLHLRIKLMFSQLLEHRRRQPLAFRMKVF